jgi:hypothetical protein
LTDQVYCDMRSVGDQMRDRPLGEFHEAFFDWRHVRPMEHRGRSKYREDLEKLVLGVLPWEQGLQPKHLCHQTSQREHVGWWPIILKLEQDLWTPIPPRRHIICKRDLLDLPSFKSFLLSLQILHCTKVHELHFISHEDYILRFDVSMKEPTSMDMVHCFNDL